jgi:hypothetical protein
MKSRITTSAAFAGAPGLVSFAKFILWILRPDSLVRCREYLEQAIVLDPEFALAHCGCADCFLVFSSLIIMPAHEAMPLLREQARKALDIDPSLPEAHAMLGVVAAVYDLDWNEAERQFHLSIAQDSVPPRVRQLYGYFYLLPMGRTEDALEQLNQGLKEDPLNVMARYGLATALFFAGRLADAQLEAYKILEFEENHPLASHFLAATCVLQEKWEEALKFSEKVPSSFAPGIGILAGVLKHMGETSRAEELIQTLLPGQVYGAPLGLATLYLTCGEIDKAADWAEEAVKERNPGTAVSLAWLFRSTSRWPKLAKMMNLPEEVR